MQKPPVEENPQIKGCICLILGRFKRMLQKNHYVMQLIRHTRFFPVLFEDKNQDCAHGNCFLNNDNLSFVCDNGRKITSNNYLQPLQK